MKVLDPQLKLRIVVPCHNEEENLQMLLARLIPSVSHYDYSVLFVDDGSTDDTLVKLQALSKLDDRIQYISLSRNFGHQNALKAGYDHSLEADAVISMDGDLQHPPELIPEMVTKWMQGYKIVYTIRNSDSRLPFFKRTTSFFFYKIFSSLTGNNLIPGTADFRLLDKSVVDVIHRMPENNLFIRGLVSWVGFKATGIEYVPGNRYKGETTYTIPKMINFAINGITSFGTSPIRLSFYIGTICSLLAFLYGIYAIAVHFFSNHTVPGWTSVIASLLFLSGIQLVMIGIIGEYIGKIYMEAKKRPNYIISESKIKC